MAPADAVLIVGAGPAGLVLGCLLRRARIECTIFERQSRADVESRARAGLLAANTVRVLEEHGLADGLRANGRTHASCAFRADGIEFELAYDRLGKGEVHTVYPQQDLLRDLVASFLDRGGQILFDANVTAIDGIDGEHPAVTYVTADGQIGTATGTFIAGCDGRHGVSRQAMRANGFRRYDRDHGVSWLAVLARAPQSMAATTYAIHEDGFAGHMAGTETVTGYCLQCPRGADPSSWSEDRIWSELARRMRADRFGALKQGEIFERVVVDMGATVIDPLQQGRLFLVGDAASLISPPSAKGANLAVMEAETLALAMRRAIRHRADDELRRYSADCLPRIWRAQEFSHWMMNLLHGPSGEEPEAVFMRALQRARLTGLQGSRTYQDHFAESFVGI